MTHEASRCIRRILKRWWDPLFFLPFAGRTLPLVLAACVLIRVTLAVSIPLLTGRLVQSVVEAIRAGPALPEAQSLPLGLILLVGAFLLANILSPMQEALVELIRQRVDSALQEQTMLTTLEPSGIAHLEAPAFQDLVAKAWERGRMFTPGSAVAGLATITTWRLQVIALTIFLAGFRWWLAALLFSVHLFLVYQFRKILLNAPTLLGAQARTLRRAEYFHALAIDAGPAKEIRLFGLADWIRHLYRDHALAAFVPLWRTRGRFVPLGLAAIALELIVALLAFGELARAGFAGEINLGELTAFGQVILGILTVRLSNADLQVAYGKEAVSAIRALHQTPSSGLYVLGHRHAEDQPRDKIRFDAVCFRYPSAEQEILHGLTLEIPAGRSLAIVGPNGAGKTTLVKLLARLYDPTSGRIKVDGIDLREFDPISWRRQVAVLFQDFIRYKLSVADNIIMGASEHAGDEEALRRSAQRAGIIDLLTSLPLGWETPLSREISGGVELSDGQWQRLALARALFGVEAGASILVLDEPAAHLDVRAEAKFYDRFLEITHGLTTIIISHRFSTVRNAERICVLEGGHMIEAGTHKELLALGGRYATMFRFQAERFTESIY